MSFDSFRKAYLHPLLVLYLYPVKKKSILSHTVTEEDIEMIYSEIKSALLENNVALSVLEGIDKENDFKEVSSNINSIAQTIQTLQDRGTKLEEDANKLYESYQNSLR